MDKQSEKQLADLKAMREASRIVSPDVYTRNQTPWLVPHRSLIRRFIMRLRRG